MLNSFNRPFKRYFLKKHALKNRFSIIAGQRGVGKTTAMIQYIYSFIQGDILSKQALYVPVDHFMVSTGLSRGWRRQQQLFPFFSFTRIWFCGRVWYI